MSEILFTGITSNELFERIGQLIDCKLGKFAPHQKKVQSNFITRHEVAALLKISLPTLNEWTKLGWLQSYKVGNRVFYKAEEVEASVEKLATSKYKKGGVYA
jgi:excisionase family DNA binding protein